MERTRLTPWLNKALVRTAAPLMPGRWATEKLQRQSMSDKSSSSYLNIEEYTELAATIHATALIIMLTLARVSSEPRDVIIRNFIAKGSTCLRSILAIWQLNDFENCWVFYRIMLDRPFHLRALVDNNEFETFEKWSFIQQYKTRHNARSDPELRPKVSPGKVSFTPEQKQRYLQLLKENIVWSRPKAEQVAKKMNWQFLYKYGYDYASTLVHPMATDGEQDFQLLLDHQLGLEDDQKGVLNNAVITQLLLMQTGLNSGNFRWRSLLYDFLDHCLAALDTHDRTYGQTFAKIAAQEPGFQWCERRPK
jgi:hypothetical protein